VKVFERIHDFLNTNSEKEIGYDFKILLIITVSEILILVLSSFYHLEGRFTIKIMVILMITLSIYGIKSKPNYLQN
jgi:hypothetical protein